MGIPWFPLFFTKLSPFRTQLRASSVFPPDWKTHTIVQYSLSLSVLIPASSVFPPHCKALNLSLSLSLHIEGVKPQWAEKIGR